MTPTKTAIAAALFLLTSSFCFSQIKEYQYKFQITGVAEKDTVYLANYYGKGLYYFDTAYVGKNSTFIFKKKKDLKPGIFAVVLGGNKKYFEIVINEPAFSVKSDTANLDQSSVFEGSPENTIFKKYKDFMVSKNIEAVPLRAELDSTKDEKVKVTITKQLIAIDEQIKAYQKKFVAENRNFYTAQMVAMLVEVDIPDAPKDALGKIDSTWSYYYYRDHYFDNVDCKNDFLVNCPIFHNKLEKFFKQVVLQQPDTICRMTRQLTNKMDAKGDMFKYTVNHVNEAYNKSDLMGMDAVFVCLADEYYLSGEAYWLDTARVAKIRDFAENIRPILIGKPAYPLSLADSTHTNWLKLYNEKSEYTVLVFWEPTCGHCKKEMPILAELYNKTGGKDFGVYAVSSDSDADWKKFIVDNKMNFTNVAVPSEIKKDQNELYKLVTAGKTDVKSLNYSDTYDVFSTPKVFILNKEKKIVAKQVAIENLEDLLKQLRQIEKNKKIN